VTPLKTMAKPVRGLPLTASKKRSSSETPARSLAKALAFVIMPMRDTKTTKAGLRWKKVTSSQWDANFKYIHDALTYRYEVVRDIRTGNIIHGLITYLHKAEVVIADLTGLNPNVMYELGIRHSFPGKKVLILTQDLREITFDLQHEYHVEYGWQTPSEVKSLKANLLSTLKKMDQNDGATYGPVQTHLEETEYVVSRIDQQRVERRLISLLFELEEIGNYMTNYVNRLIEAYPLLLESQGKKQYLVTDAERIQYLLGKNHRSWIDDYMLRLTPLTSIDLMLAENYFDVMIKNRSELSSVIAATRALRRLQTPREVCHITASPYLSVLLTTYIAVKINQGLEFLAGRPPRPDMQLSNLKVLQILRAQIEKVLPIKFVGGDAAQQIDVDEEIWTEVFSSPPSDRSHE